MAFLGLLFFIFAVEPVWSAAKGNNVFRQWQRNPPSGLTGVQKRDLAVCAQWEAEQRRLLHRWQVACCERGFELMRPGLDDNKYYTDIIMLGPEIIPLLAKRVEWEKQPADLENISADVKRLLDCIAGLRKMPATDPRNLYGYN